MTPRKAARKPAVGGRAAGAKGDPGSESGPGFEAVVAAGLRVCCAGALAWVSAPAAKAPCTAMA